MFRNGPGLGLFIHGSPFAGRCANDATFTKFSRAGFPNIDERYGVTSVWGRAKLSSNNESHTACFTGHRDTVLEVNHQLPKTPLSKLANLIRSHRGTRRIDRNHNIGLNPFLIGSIEEGVDAEGCRSSHSLNRSGCALRGQI